MLNEWNQLLRYLAAQEDLTRPSYDLAILAGNSLPYVTSAAAELYHSGRAKRLLLSGGVGHATGYLQRNYQHQGFEVAAGSESEMNGAYLQQLGVPAAAILLEERSTNSGENAAFSLAVLKAAGGELPQEVLLLQDPLLQRRIKAAFQKNWRETHVQFTNYVPLVPQLKSFQELPRFTEPRLDQLWSAAYFTDLALGEIPRLRNDPAGYGPKGRDFIAAVTIPAEVEAAFAQISRYYSFKNEI